ncbi:MAG: M23 family metallopeptidase [Verrucomicrobiota bacterium]|nr:M23 family metallopeptidase [Verrucomicrobiota bacterium]
MNKILFLLVGILLGAICSGQAGEDLNIVLPTPNKAIFSGGGDDFYMYTDRDFDGKKTFPWEGGQYGYTRSPRRTSYGVMMTRFHEGIDIKPVSRDASGEPLDPIYAVDHGVVAHVNDLPGLSNYGRYIVILHQWQGSEYYTLYAHLNAASVVAGQEVKRGQTIGRLGHTGDGINKARSHLHFEVGMVMNDHFQGWFDQYMPGEVNQQGLYNGMNLNGWNPADFLLALKKNPSLQIAQFIREEEGVLWKVIIPNPGRINVLEKYPWLREAYNGSPLSWEVHIGDTGIPVRFIPRSEVVTEPRLLWVRKEPLPLQFISKGMLTGSSSKPALTKGAYQYLMLMLQQ